jgi:FkbM family methyltransferase
MEKIIAYKNKNIKFYDLLQQGHNIDKFILNGNLFNRQDHKFDILLKYIKPGDVVYDIGAYIGTFAIPFAIEGMNVYAFEGFPSNFERLSKNCEPYNIQTYQIAVSNINKKSFTKFNDCTATEAIPAHIEYVIFDEYMKSQNLPEPKLVKLDIEGMETIALFGMAKLLKEIRPIWQIGYHEGLNIKFEDYPGFVKPEDGGFDFNEFVKLGYNVLNESGRVVNHFSRWGEYICVPKEKLNT